jgi:diguanylate cyclase (GGDEF)-like protein
MRGDSIIALKIGTSAPGTTITALRPVLERAIALIGYVLLAVEDERERVELTARLDDFRARFDSASDQHDTTALTTTCFDLCEHAIQALQVQQAGRREELRRLVTLVRETVSVLRGDGDAFSSNIIQAAGRFNSIIQIDDVQELKQRLMAEVDDLQRVAAEQQQHWHQAVEGFETRIVTLEQQLVAVQHEASLDGLTGIANRRAFERAVRETLASSQRELIIAMVDLDEFKAVNDLGGHAAGDRVLQNVARTLRSLVRRHDVVARIGGDEFALLAIGATLRDTEPRIRAIVGTLANIPTGIDSPATVSVSCGMAEYSAGDTLESLIRRADQALYEAKKQGKRRLVVKSPPFIRDLLKRKH